MADEIPRERLFSAFFPLIRRSRLLAQRTRPNSPILLIILYIFCRIANIIRTNVRLRQTLNFRSFLEERARYRAELANIRSEVEETLENLERFPQNQNNNIEVVHYMDDILFINHENSERSRNRDNRRFVLEEDEIVIRYD